MNREGAKNAKKEIKYSPRDKRPGTIKPGDKFMLDPNDYMHIHGYGKIWNRTGHAVILEFEAEDIRHGS